MRIPLLILIPLFFFSTSYSQSTTNDNKTIEAITRATALINQLNEVKSIKEFRNFKQDVEQNLVDIVSTNTNIMPEELAELQSRYGTLKVKFDVFVDLIKSDILSTGNLSRFMKNPDKHAAGYLSAYAEARNYYQTEYLPYLSQLSNTKEPITLAAAVTLGIEGIKLLVLAIEQKKMRKEIAYQAFGMLDKSFGDKLYLKPWNVLLPQFTDIGKAKLISRNNFFSSPIIDSISGSVTLVQKRTTGYVNVLFPDKKNISEENSEIQGGGFKVFSTAHSDQTLYQPGDEFKLQVKSNGFVYIFTQNVDRSMRVLYPYSNETINAAGYKKDVEQANSELAYRQTGLDGNTIVTFPLPKAGYPDQVYRIDAKGTQDNLFIIISKSEILDLNAVVHTIGDGSFTINATLNDVHAGSDGSIVFPNAHDIIPIKLLINKRTK